MESVCYNKTEIQIYTVFLTVLLLVKPMNQIVIAYFPSLSGTLMSVLYLVLDLGLIILTISKGKVYILKLNILAATIIMVLFILSRYYLHRTNDSILYLMPYIIIPLLLTWNLDIDYKLFYCISLVIPLFGIPVLGKMFYLRYGGIEMGTSYTFLLVSIVPIVYLFRVREKSILLVVAAVIDLLYTAQILMYGMRGSVLSIAVCVVAIAFSSYSNKNGPKKNSFKYICFIVLLVLIILYYQQLFALITTYLKSVGIAPYFVTKFIRLEEKTGILNGRDTIYGLTLDYIKNRPLFGYGFDSFDYYTGFGYPHNFILQLIFDFGIVGALLIMIPFMKGFYMHLQNCTYNEYILFIVIFVSIIPGALFSGNIWNNMGFWVIVSYLYRKASMVSINENIKGELDEDSYRFG